MQKITPHLWFNRNAAEAATFYASLIPGSQFEPPTVIADTPSGSVEVFQVTLGGLSFQFLSAGAEFRFTPAVSFRLNCHSEAEVDRMTTGLAERGSFLMPLDRYPFSGRYAWVVDRFGLSWQVMLDDIHPASARIVPTLMFTGTNCGQAEQAVRRYAALFKGAVTGEIDRYEAGPGPDQPGTVRQAGFKLAGLEMAAMDSAQDHGFTFTEAISFMVNTADQDETDHYWDGLTADPTAEACGWLKDPWGLSWQIVPQALGRLMGSGDPKVVGAVTQAFLKMKKLEITGLERAADQGPGR